jgi:hypothetical protein
MFIITPGRNPFQIYHDARPFSHSSSIYFLVCVAVAAVVAGLYLTGSTSCTYWVPVNRVYLGLLMISARSPYSLPVLVSRAQSNIMSLILLARLNASFFNVLYSCLIRWSWIRVNGFRRTVSYAFVSTILAVLADGMLLSCRLWRFCPCYSLCVYCVPMQDIDS